MDDIYHDNGAALGRRTRYFRNAAGGGVEWIYAVDFEGPAPRWYGYLSTGGWETVTSLMASGMDIEPVKPYRTEFTDAGEQTVIPGCERDDERTGAKQMSLF